MREGHRNATVGSSDRALSGAKSIEEGRLTPPSREKPSASQAKGSLGVQMPSSSVSPKIRTYECDYDRDPSPLYRAVEAKQWDEVLKLCDENPALASTWVLRKEKDGQLRWRLLPLHAAIIFQAPHEVIDALLTSFPQSAMCKDDQGMLPLHLVLRNLPLQFDVIEELLTVHPAAIYVQDRKGRTPLEGGLVATGGKDHNPGLSVLELYTQIAAAGEKQRWRLAHDREAQQRVEAAQQQFAAEKEALQEIHKKAIQHANEQHVHEVVQLQKQLKELKEANKLLRKQKLELEGQKRAGLFSSAPSGAEGSKKDRRWRQEAENEALKEMVQLLLTQQASLRQSLEAQEKQAIEQEAARQKLWQELITQQHKARTNARKNATSWIEELKATESSIETAINHIRQVSEIKVGRSNDEKKEDSTVKTTPSMESALQVD